MPDSGIQATSQLKDDSFSEAQQHQESAFLVPDLPADPLTLTADSQNIQPGDQCSEPVQLDVSHTIEDIAASIIQTRTETDADLDESSQPIPPLILPEPSVKQQPHTPIAELEQHSVQNSVPVTKIPEVVSSSEPLANENDTATRSQQESQTSINVKNKEEKPNAATSRKQEVLEAVMKLLPITYQPLAPPPATAPSRTHASAATVPKQISNTDLRLRLQIVFGRDYFIKNVALVPDRRDAMPNEIEVNGTQATLHLTRLRDDCYEPVGFANAGNALIQGVEWRGRGDARRWRWVLGGRELYVLAPGDEFGLHGFISTARLWLNVRHVVLATKRLREEVEEALTEAGCATPEVSDDTASGVPNGWLLFRDVMPTHAVPMRDERDILNALCPAHEIEPHFVGGIRLERNTWLAGYPPRIRFTGEFASGFQVKIDDHPVQPASDGTFEAPGWDSEGEHRLWFGDQATTYSLCTMDEAWEQWHAHDFGTGAAICGARTCPVDATRRRQVRVPASNPLLIGARPGEIFLCYARSDVRCKILLAWVSFEPVWALPLDPAHTDKQSARILLLQPSEPQNDIQVLAENRAAKSKLVAWSATIREAGCKGLRLAQEDEQAKALWQRYRRIAKQLRRRMR